MNMAAENNSLSMTNMVSDITGPVQRVLDYAIFPSSKITVASLLALIFLFVLVVVAERVVRRYFITRLLRRTHLEPAMQFALARVIGYALLGLGFFISLQMVGVNLTSLSFLAGAVGVGFGFGLQNIISNFISGLIILAERPIAIGDRVEIGGVAGQVREISLRSTTVITNDNMAIIVPNADFITQRVTNWSYEDPRVRFRIPFGVAYGTDLPKLRKLMLEVADGASQGVEGARAGAVLRRLRRQLPELRARPSGPANRPSPRGGSAASCSLPSRRSCARAASKSPTRNRTCMCARWQGTLGPFRPRRPAGSPERRQPGYFTLRTFRRRGVAADVSRRHLRREQECAD